MSSDTLTSLIHTSPLTAAVGGTYTIFHNPACGTSRAVLALLQAHGIEPVVLDYLRSPPDRVLLKALIGAMGVSVRDVLRTQEPLAQTLGLLETTCEDEALLQAMVAHPVLINRPIVVSPKGVRLCRPADSVQDLLR